MHRSSIPTASSHEDHHHRYFPGRLDLSFPEHYSPEQKDVSGGDLLYQHTGAQSSSLHMPALSTPYQRLPNQSSAGQQSSNILYQSTRKSKILVLMHQICTTVELVHITPHRDLNRLSTRTIECIGRLSQQTLLHRPQWELNSKLFRNMSYLGSSRERSLHNSIQREMQTILLEGRAQPQINETHPDHSLASCMLYTYSPHAF